MRELRTAGNAATNLEAAGRDIATLFKENRITSVVIDTEDGFIKMGLVRPIAEAMGARCLKLDELRAEGLANAVRLQLPTAASPDPMPLEEPGTRA